MRKELSSFFEFRKRFKNNQNISRTTSGKLDTSASQSKKNTHLSRSDLVDRVRINHGVLTRYLWNRSKQGISTKKDIRKAFFDIVCIVNQGIVAEPMALRTWNRQIGNYSYLDYREIKKSLNLFFGDCIVFLRKAKKGEFDPVELAAYVEYQLMFIHALADGCGRSSRALSALFLLYLGCDLPCFSGYDEYYGAMNKGLEGFKSYYRSCVN